MDNSLRKKFNDKEWYILLTIQSWEEAKSNICAMSVGFKGILDFVKEVNKIKFPSEIEGINTNELLSRYKSLLAGAIAVGQSH